MIFRLSKLAKRLARLKGPLFAILVATLGCRADGSLADPTHPDASKTKPPVASITVSPASDSGDVGSSVQFTATVRGTRGDTLSGVAVTWAVLDTTVADVTTTGLVTYKSAGSTDVLASADGTQGKGRVNGKPPRAWSVTVSPALVNLTQGESATLAATALAKDGSSIPNRAATWRSSSPEVVSVDATGTVIAGGLSGGATITATIDGKDGMATVNVYPTPIEVVVVRPDTVATDVGTPVQFVAEARDSTGVPVTGRSFTWSSANPAVASVSPQGVATGLAAGVAAIVATADGVSDTATLSVSPTPVATVAVSPTAASLDVGGTKQLTATLKDAAGGTLADRPVNWSSSAPVVASVTAAGLVTALGPGSATITATAEGQSGQAQITVASTTTDPGALSWFSDFRSGTGTRTNVLQDGTGSATFKWNGVSPTDNGLLAVVSSSGLNFPTSNVLRVDGNGGAGRKVFADGVIGNTWPLPAVGEFVFYRMYVRDAMASGMPSVLHHLIESHVGDIAWTWIWSGGSMCWAMYRWNALHLNDPTSYADSFFCLPGYVRNQTYRLEWRLERDTPTSAKVQLRAYDASGTLIADNDVFRNSLGTLNQRIATAGVKVEGMTTATMLAEDLQSLDAGQSGQSNTNWTPGNYAYFGGFAVRVSGDPNGWIGPYRLTAQER